MKLHANILLLLTFSNVALAIVYHETPPSLFGIARGGGLFGSDGLFGDSVSKVEGFLSKKIKPEADKLDGKVAANKKVKAKEAEAKVKELQAQARKKAKEAEKEADKKAKELEAKSREKAKEAESKASAKAKELEAKARQKATDLQANGTKKVNGWLKKLG